jgi:hypothetical protein
MAPTARNFRLFSVQAALFTPGPREQFRAPSFLATILGSFASRYDGDIQSLPSSPQQLALPAGKRAKIGLQLAIGVPEVTLTSADKYWKLEATPERLDSFWTSQTADESPQILRDVCKRCIEPLLEYQNKKTDQQVGRLALVVRRWFPSDAPAINLALMFCKPQLVEGQPLCHSRSFRLDNLKKYDGPFGPVNSWVRCSSNEVHDRPSVSIEQDINTLAEETESTSFRPENTETFFEWATGQAEEILTLYFPNTID